MPDENMTDEDLAKKIIKRQAQLAEIRQPWEAVWQDITDYVVPIRANVTRAQDKTKRRITKIYDGTALTALDLFADGLHGYLVSPAYQWFKLEMADRRLRGIPEVKEWLQEVEWCMYAALRRSNFYNAMSEFFRDGGSVGTAGLYSEEDIGEQKIVFTTPNPWEVCIAENKYGMVDTVFRNFKLSAKQLVERFGQDQLTDQVKNSYLNKPYTEYPVIHAVYPREARDVNKRDAKNKPFASCHVLIDGEKFLGESGYDRNPCPVWRYQKNSGEIYGASPAWFALAEIMGLNIISKSLLGATELATEPAYNVPSELQGKVRIVPRGMNYYADEKRIVSPVHTGVNFPVGIDREDKKRAIIEDHFKVGFFLMLNRADKVMTATEIIEKQGEKAAVLGTAISRLNTESLDPTMDRVFDIEYAAGRLPPVPDIILEYGDGRIETDYLGPLAQAQKRLFQSQGVVRSLEGIAPILQVNPETADVVGWDESARDILDSYGMPQKNINTRDAVTAIREARARARAEEQQKQDVERAALTAKDAAEADARSEGALSEVARKLVA